MKASLVLLSGGKGKRMGLEMPKQYLRVQNKRIAQYALDAFSDYKSLCEVVIVCDPNFRSLFDLSGLSVPVRFANSGQERQKSLFNGLNALHFDGFVLVHDAARPLLNPLYIDPLVKLASDFGSSALGVKSVCTLKKASDSNIIEKTIDRSFIWEMQTPQVATKKDLQRALAYAEQKKIKATDEASLLELIKIETKILEGDSFNFKITHQSDLEIFRALVSTQKKSHAQV